MSKSITAIGGAVAVSLFLSNAPLAFNPQPDPPGKRLMKQNDKSLGGPDTKALKHRKGGGSTSLPAVQKSVIDKGVDHTTPTHRRSVAEE